MSAFPTHDVVILAVSERSLGRGKSHWKLEFSWWLCSWAERVRGSGRTCVGRNYSCLRVLLCTGKKKHFPRSSLPPPPCSICIKISVKIKVCFCILQIVIQTVSRKELVIHFYIRRIYTHAWAPPKTIKLAGKKKKNLFPFSFQAQTNLHSDFQKLIANRPPFLPGVCCRYGSCPFPSQLCFFLLKQNLLSVRARGWLSAVIYWGGDFLPPAHRHPHSCFVFANFIFRRIYTRSSYINSSGDKSAAHFHKQKLLLASYVPFFFE